jgi:hypothetical protein
VPGTDINESTLIASDYLNHFRKLVTCSKLLPLGGKIPPTICFPGVQ